MTQASIEEAIRAAAPFIAEQLASSPINSASIARHGRTIRVMSWNAQGEPVTAVVQVGEGS